MWQIVNYKNGISSYEAHRAIGVTQKTAWFIYHRIRFALYQGIFENPLSGKVEADETLIVRKARNMSKNVKACKVTGIGGKDKTVVMGILERGGKVLTNVIPNQMKNSIQAEGRRHVEAGCAPFTDALKSFKRFGRISA